MLKNMELEIETGRIQGVTENILGQSIEKFIGIPYGQSPIGELRFKKPIPHEKWSGVKICSTFPSAPWQHLLKNFENEHSGESVWNPKEQFNEDCLYLNVWKKQLCKTHEEEDDMKKRPVMVWFYGGGFVSGSSSLNIYDGSVLASQSSVIVVSVNYRVGSMGFLYLNEEAPGNQGLWDQLLALKWIHNNICKFGGDATNVTLFGESAGAVSVCCHLLCPHSAPLFNKVIMQSGCALNYWAVSSKDEMRRRAGQALCESLGIDTNKSSADKLKELQQIEPQVLVDKEWICEGALQYPWTPIVDNDFLPDSPEVLLKDYRFKNCPIIIGNTEHEGSYFLLYENQIMNFVKTKHILNQQDIHQLTELTFPYYPNYPTITLPYIIEQIANQYYSNIGEINSEEGLVSASQALGHCQLTHHTLELARLSATRNDSVYVFHFNYRTRNDPWPEWTGVKHADEIQYVFGLPLRACDEYSDYERQLSSSMISWWTTFAKDGKPSFEGMNEWLPFDINNEQCLHIASDIKLETYHMTREYDFWQKIYEHYRKSLISSHK